MNQGGAGQQIVAAFVTAVVIVGVVAIVYQLSEKSGGTKIATGAEQNISTVAGDLFKG